MIYHTQQTQSGFSLVEMLVAVSILLLVIVGPMTVTSRAAKSSSFSTEQSQAFFLAQEGLELAQRERDNLLLANFLPVGPGHIANPWGIFRNNPAGGKYANCHAVGGCGLEWNDTATDLVLPINCAIVGNCQLHYDAGAKRSRFTHDDDGGANEKTLFTRKIYFSEADNMKVRVRSVVTWRTGSVVAPQTVETQTYLYNIYAKP